MSIPGERRSTLLMAAALRELIWWGKMITEPIQDLMKSFEVSILYRGGSPEMSDRLEKSCFPLSGGIHERCDKSDKHENLYEIPIFHTPRSRKAGIV